MYEVWKGDELLALVEKPNFIRRHEEGFFLLCDEEEANGIAVDGTPYHLSGKPELEGCESVLLVEVDAGKTLDAKKADKTELQAMWDSMAAAYGEGVKEA